MNSTDIEKQLEINKNRQDIIDALLMVYDHSDLIQTIKSLSGDAKKEIMDRFQLNEILATAIMDIKKPISDIPHKNILDEKENLERIEKEIKANLS